MESLTLLPREDRRLSAGHLWTFSNEINWNGSSRPEPGEARKIVSARGHTLGWADCHPHTLIAARLQPELPNPNPDVDWWVARMQRAMDERASWLGSSEFCRLVNADADLLPGLTIDRYGRYAVVSAQTVAMDRRAPLIAQALLNLGLAGVKLLGQTRARELEGIACDDQWIGEVGHQEWVPVAPNTWAAAPLSSGQKTGFFLDQAENRRRIAPLAFQRKVLDVCSYTGGWGLAMAHFGAQSTTFVDSDTSALQLVEAGWNHSGFTAEPELVVADAFEALEALEKAGRRFSMVVLDPPAFAKSRKSIEPALAGYQKLARLGLRVLEPGGILVTCSCSGLVSPDDFHGAVARAFRQERRSAKLIHSLGASPDHPVHPSMPETRYLKVLVWSV